jgi:hypothetical protein
MLKIWYFGFIMAMYCTYKLHVRIFIVGASEQYKKIVQSVKCILLFYSLCALCSISAGTALTAQCQNTIRYQNH